MHWNILPAQPELTAQLVETQGFQYLLAKTLTARSINSAAEATAFIQADLLDNWSDPKSITGMVEVCNHLEDAIRNQKKLVVFGDYDVDGISASAVLVKALGELGTDIQVVLPRRNGEGYGLTAATLERIMQFLPDLLITVDCGVSAAKEIEILQSNGVEVLVTDHHECGEDLPVGIPITDPKLEADGPSFNLAGVGVVLKLIDLLGKRFNKPELWRRYTDLAALGTIADQMPLLAENRALVKDGLGLINKSMRPGISAITALSAKPDTELTATNLTYGLIPRLNAAGRISDPLIALELLTTDDPGSAARIAQDLETLNQERRALEAELVAEAIAQAQSQAAGRKVIVVGGEGWHDGVRGIVASRLVREFGVPAIVFSIEGNEAVGSGRTVGSINLHKCVLELSDMLIRFGGHEGAIGVSIESRLLDQFKQALETVMEAEPEESFYPALQIDAKVKPSELGIIDVQELQLLEPFGSANPAPVYLLEKVFIKHARTVGSEANHLSLRISDNRQEFQAIWFNCPKPSDYLQCNQAVDVVFNVQVEEWRDRKQVKLHVIDITLSAAADRPVGVLEKPEAAQSQKTQKAPPDKDKRYWRDFALRNAADLNQAIAKVILADKTSTLHPSQLQALESLDLGNNTLVIMATGRGKSLIFQIQAIKLAITQNKQSIFVYPLRALINDQEFALQRSLEEFGLTCQAITGATANSERERVYQGFADGRIDILLTTPEFLLFHKNELLTNANIGFVVIDEAHHIATSSENFRPLYTKLQTVNQMQPDATILALTATANLPISEEISGSLNIQKLIIDDTQRTNLMLDDQRNIQDREQYLQSIIADSSKAIVYVNSRDLSIQLTRILRKYLPQVAQKIGFYNAGLSRADRLKVESAFRAEDLICIVATSAFGEGVNIPNIRDVVLYDLPFSLIDYNQMSGRAGRDGRAAMIHLLCQQEDCGHNSRILALSAPSRAQLSTLWRAAINLEAQQQNSKSSTEDSQSLFNALSILTQKIDQDSALEIDAVQTGLAIFKELGLLKLDESCKLHTVKSQNGSKVELAASSIFLEGLEAIQSFDNFKDWLFAASAEELLLKLQKPLLPTQ